MKIRGRFLVKGDKRNAEANNEASSLFRILASDTSLSFWGGIDPVTAIIVDQTHPLVGECVTDTILCLPSGRGSCTASQVLLDGAAIGGILSNGTLSLGGNEAAEHSKETLTEDVPIHQDVYGSINVKYNKQETQLLQRCHNDAERMALRVIFQYAHLLNSGSDQRQQLVSYLNIENAHIDGCTYIGPGGLEFVRRLVQAGGKVCVPTTLNAVSTDRRRWQALQVPAERAMASIALGDAYLELGCQPSFTCAPYLLPNTPTLGQHIAWGESNAVVYANSVLGARTEKLADYLDICCAIAGIVPAVGVHLPKNRRPQVLLDARQVLAKLVGDGHVQNFDLLFPILGHLCGSLSDGKVPLLTGLEPLKDRVTVDHMKALCAAYGTTGSSPLIHVAGVTPEACDPATIDELKNACTIFYTVTERDVFNTFQTLDSHTGIDEDIQLIALGNPHLSIAECATLANLISAHGDTKHSSVRVVACLSRSVYEQAQVMGYVSVMATFGVEFINDTCWCMLLDAPLIPADTNAKILCNSGKYAHYGPGLTNRAFRFGSMSDCIQTARSGSYVKHSLRTRNATNVGLTLFPRVQKRSVVSRAFPYLNRFLLRR
ncbi:hypothetical protein MPSEU_000474100 [Mayamaea pseudoterrestris]|nr:hypothetical protein MPSEU_000474100 [Mayamaea pseudoterrestris]